MRIQYMSDLHQEFQYNRRLVRDYDIPVTGDILVLAGDTMYLKDRTAVQMHFWKWASANYREVLLVPGNHEYYGDGDVMDRGLQWNWMFRENVGYYQNQVKRIGDTDLIQGECRVLPESGEEDRGYRSYPQHPLVACPS